MLKLGRKHGTSVMIGDDIKITVLPARGKNEITLGFEAPRDVQIHREEVYQRIQAGIPQHDPETFGNR